MTPRESTAQSSRRLTPPPISRTSSVRVKRVQVSAARAAARKLLRSNVCLSMVEPPCFSSICCAVVRVLLENTAGNASRIICAAVLCGGAGEIGMRRGEWGAGRGGAEECADGENGMECHVFLSISGRKGRFCFVIGLKFAKAGNLCYNIPREFMRCSVCCGFRESPSAFREGNDR